MSGQQDRQPQNEIDGLYYQLMTTPQREHQPEHHRLVAPETTPEADPDHAYDYHPDDLKELVQWEQKTYSNIALWLLLMTVVSAVVVPFAPVFTMLVAIFFALMSVVFYLWSKTATIERVEKSLNHYQHNPMMQWAGASTSLSISAVIYLLAMLVPYSAVPATVQTLLFLLAMNFTLYTPIAIIHTILQRTLRKKRLSIK